jgi:hypothetical protein
MLEESYTHYIMKKIDIDIDLSNLYLEELPGFLTGLHANGNFYCYNNQLTSLQGAPKYVGGYFYCYNNHLMSLQGAPESVGGNFSCARNHLTSLQGAPESVGGNFSCARNHLTSLQGAPESVGGDFYCHNNKVKFTEEQVRSVCNVRGIVYTLHHEKN